MIKPLRHPLDFLKVAAAQAPTRAAARAAMEGNYTIPLQRKLPWGNTGWTFRVWSTKRNQWCVCVEVLEEERRYKTTWVRR